MRVNSKSVLKLNQFILFAAKFIEIFVSDIFLPEIFLKTVQVYSFYSLNWEY